MKQVSFQDSRISEITLGSKGEEVLGVAPGEAAQILTLAVGNNRAAPIVQSALLSCVKEYRVRGKDAQTLYIAIIKENDLFHIMEELKRRELLANHHIPLINEAFGLFLSYIKNETVRWGEGI